MPTPELLTAGELAAHLNAVRLHLNALRRAATRLNKSPSPSARDQGALLAAGAERTRATLANLLIRITALEKTLATGEGWDRRWNEVNQPTQD